MDITPARSPQASADTLTAADMRELIALIGERRYAQLEGRARELVEQHPDSGFVWKVLGVSLRMQGKDALQALERTAALLPDDAEAHGNLGGALLDLGRSQEAAASYRRALLLKPDDAEAHHRLGTALRRLGQLEEAVASYRRSCAIRAEYAEAHHDLGNALLELGRPDEAVASYRRALALDPGIAETHNNLGNALLALGQLDDSVASYQRALAIRPAYAEAHSNLVNALRGLGRLEEAVASARRALELKADFAEACNNLGNALLDLGQADEAAGSYRRALQINPGYAEAHANLGIALRLQGRSAEAQASCRRALEINPHAVATIQLLAELHADRGEFAEAEALFKRALSMDPQSAEAWAAIPYLRRMTADDAAWLAGAQRIVAQPTPPRQEIPLRYAIGKYFDDLREFEQAFASFQRANELSKQYQGGYDRRQMAQAVDVMIQSNDRAWLSRMRDDSNASVPGASVRPVFIVGMPRSGTTLAEQILASHPAVFGAGELTFWRKAVAGELRAGMAGELAAQYLRLLDGMSADALRVIDKMPGNFLHLGLINAALPNARIIHMRRNPLDTCLSIYFQHFRTAHSYANDLDDLAHYYGQYLRLMQHWRATLPAQTILELPYEALIDDQQAWSRRMLDFIGLPWDEHCMDFHQTHRSVVTASKWQVRQKISSSSVGRWHNYQRFVGPLLGLL